MELTDEQRAQGSKLSGPPPDDFTEGWALVHPPWTHTPHFWRRIERETRFVSLCGQLRDVAHDIRGSEIIFEPGDFIADRCSKCALKRSKEISGRR